MKILLLAVGKRHNPDIAAAIADYTNRLERVADVQWQIIPPAVGKTSPEQARRTESRSLEAKLQADDTVVLLDERGQQLTSPDLSHIVEVAQHGGRRLVCIIGGAYGVDEQLMARATLVWSLSELVFPHQLVRLLLVEQLYRAFTIMRGEPYHHQ